MLAALPSCITVGGRDDDAPPDVFHVVESGPAAGPAAAKGAARAPETVVEVREFRAADRFDRHVVRMDAPGRITPMERDFWADEPARAATDAVREALTAAGTFKAVVEPGHAADVVLEGVVREFAWSAGTPSKAVVRLRLTWSDARSGNVLVSQLHDASEDLPGPGTDGLGPAMAKAVARATAAAAQAALSVVGGVPSDSHRARER